MDKNRRYLESEIAQIFECAQAREPCGAFLNNVGKVVTALRSQMLSK